MRNASLATVAVLAIGITIYAASKPDELRLVGYSQTRPSELEIRLSSPVDAVEIAVLDEVPRQLALEDVGSVPSSQPIDVDGQELKLSLDEKGRSSEYSIVVIATRDACGGLAALVEAVGGLASFCQQKDYLEIVRQPSKWLHQKFSFSKPDGYSILGRGTIDTPSEPSQMAELSFIGLPKIDGSLFSEPGDADLPTQDASFLSAMKLVRMLWSKEFRGGPTNASYDKYLRLGFDEKLARLRDGRFSAMCAGLRDLFLHASAGVPGLKARAVEALNYSPQMGELIPYGHSAAEVWLESLGKWVLIDPWVGISLARNGELLSAQDLADADPTAISVVPLLHAVSRYGVKPNGETETMVLNPADTELVNYTSQETGHIPGYLAHFRALIYRGFRIEPQA